VSQLQLFKLPKREAPLQKGCKLPASMQRFIDAGASFELVVALMEALGGLRVRIPDSADADTRVRRALGEERTAELAAIAPGMELEIPIGKSALTAIKHQNIRRDFDEGATIEYLVRKYGMVERRIRSTLVQE
jgi:hypothetical protein